MKALVNYDNIHLHLLMGRGMLQTDDLGSISRSKYARGR
jgi:hypothetical protein